MGRIAGLTREALERETDAAMEKAGGDRKKAAEILGIAIGSLDQRIARHEPLKVKWGGWSAPSSPPESVTLSRPIIPAIPERQLPVIKDNNEAIAAAMDAEDDRIRQGVQKLGLNDVELNMAMAFQSFQRRHFTTSFDLLGGGITKQFISLCTEIEAINKRLAGGFEEVDSDGKPVKLTPTMEAILREDRAKLLVIQVQMYDRATKAAMTQIEVKRLRDGKDPSGKGNDKPGFAPLAVSVTGDVHIHEKK